jgi:proton-translocating NADH-quinone oxidoreductase chain L
MPLPALLLLIATLLPLASFGVLLFVGKKLGTPLAGWVATFMISGSFLCTGIATVSWINGGGPPEAGWGCGTLPINITVPWIPAGIPTGGGMNQSHPGYLDLGIYIDSLTVVMFCMITLISMLVHVFSIGYMRDDRRFERFFTYLSLFSFSMMGVVLGGTLLQLLVFWELVGLCSYLLIGFWYEKPSATHAAMKAFIVNRVGDFGFLIGLGILFYHLGNLNLANLWIALGHAGSGTAVYLSNGTVFSARLLTITGIALFCGAMGKSAQFPLHVWLPDAMEAPTPVSALIHAATMVAAGVYLVARIFPILTPDAKLFIAIIGVITLTMSALIATVQSDIKRVLAYSTLSQLGYMILAMGVGSWVGGLFHLITHAFFKSLLFLGAGSVIHAAGHEQEMPQFGGLIRKIPVTAFTFLFGVLAIAGVGFGDIGFSGFYSKDMILAHAGAFVSLAHGAGKSSAYFALFLLPAMMTYVTAFYMMRCWMLTFWGKPRNQAIYEEAKEYPTMWLPLAMLAVLSIIGGSRLLGIGLLLENSVREDVAYCRLSDPAFDGFGSIWPAETPDASGSLTAGQQAQIQGRVLAVRYVGWAFVIGIGAAFICYYNGYRVSLMALKIRPMRWCHGWLYHRMYFDELYFVVFESIVLGISALSALFDRLVIDGVVNGVAAMGRGLATAARLNDRFVFDGAVNGAASLSQDLGAVVRSAQTGRIRLYVMLLMAAVTLGIAGTVIVVLLR